MALTEFNLEILILLTRDALSICSIYCVMLRCSSMWTPKNLTVSAIFSRCPYIVIDDSLITFLCEKLIRCVLPGFNLTLHLLHHVRIWFRYFHNLRLIYKYLEPVPKLLFRLRIEKDLPMHQELEGCH